MQRDQKAPAILAVLVDRRRNGRLHSARSPAVTALPAGRASGDRTLSRWHTVPAAEQGTRLRRAARVAAAFWPRRRSDGSFFPRPVWTPASSTVGSNSHTSAKRDITRRVAHRRAPPSTDHPPPPHTPRPHFSAPQSTDHVSHGGVLA